MITDAEELARQVAVLWPSLTVWQRLDWAKAVTWAAGISPEGNWVKVGLPMIQSQFTARTLETAVEPREARSA